MDSRGVFLKEIVIIGLGNPLFKDDGIGPRVVQELQKEELWSGVEVVEAGGSFYNYWDLLRECRFVIAVDSIRGGGPPGAIYLVAPEQLTGTEPVLGLRHEVHFLDALRMASFYEAEPEVLIIGVEPKEITLSLDLSPEVSAKIHDVVNIIRDKCEKLLS